MRRDIAVAFRRLRPDLVFALNFEFTWGEAGGVNHADHRAVGVAVLDACRDAANRWLFPELGEPWKGIKAVYVAGGEGPATHFVDVGGTIEAGIASLSEHRVYIEGLGTGFDPAEFLRQAAGYGGMAAGCEYCCIAPARPTSSLSPARKRGLRST